MQPAYVAYNALLILCNAAMVVSVVLTGKALPDCDFFFMIAVLVISSLAYFVAAMWVNRKCLGYLTSAYNLSLIHPRRAGILGFAWALNFFFLLAANSHTPGFIQIIFNEMNLIFVMLFSSWLLGKSFNAMMMTAALFVVAGGLLPLATGSGVKTTASDIGWYAMYLIGAAAIPLASIVTEFLVKLRSGDGAGPRWSADLMWLLTWQNIYTLLGVIVCAAIFYPVLGISYETVWASFTRTLHCFTYLESAPDAKPEEQCRPGVVFLLLSTLFSILATAIQAHVTRMHSAVWVTLLVSASPLLSAVWMGIPALMGRWYDAELASNSLTWFALFFIFVGVFQYKYQTAIFPTPPATTKRLRWLNADLLQNRLLFQRSPSVGMEDDRIEPSPGRPVLAGEEEEDDEAKASAPQVYGSLPADTL